MNARVKSDHRWKSVTALSGVEFVKSEYREIPSGFEKEAQAHPFLEIEGVIEVAETVEVIDEIVEPVEIEIVETIEIDTVEQVKPKAAKKPRKKRG